MIPNTATQRLLAAIAILTAIGAVSWSFRFTTTDNPALGVIREHRTLGRVTRITVDSNRDGSVDAEMIFSWSEPYEGEQFGGETPYKLIREDRDHNGRWDTWIEPIDQQDKTRVSGDTNGDGAPDWITDCDAGECEQALASLSSIRGF